MAKLCRPTINRARDQSEHGHELGMTIALDNLSGQCCRLESEFFADNSLDTRIEVRMRANGSADLSNADAFAHLGETLRGP